MLNDIQFVVKSVPPVCKKGCIVRVHADGESLIVQHGRPGAISRREFALETATELDISAWLISQHVRARLDATVGP